ncbi:MAG: carboxymuconolactone decarboxylase family protein [Rhodospirillales bacterium]|nr:carboxymuconolactone decarboxylase family protein [Rhodospirillales bacterium]
MPRITPIDPTQAEGKAKVLLDGIQKSLGMTPNLMRSLAQSPAALQAYLDFNKALDGASLNAKTREAIALTVAGENGCDYCASAHTAVGGLLGAERAELAANLDGRSNDPRVAAVLAFARAVVVKRGWVSDEDLDAARAAGLGDREITEIVAGVAVNMFTNYFNHVAGTEVDFPLVRTGQKAAA